MICKPYKGHGEVVKLLIEKGAEVNRADKDRTGRLLCCKRIGGHEEIVQAAY